MKADRIIVSRTDNVGDVVLALPMVGVLKQRYPSAEVLFLGRSYTKAVIDCCEHVDAFLDWEEVADQGTAAQAAFLRRQDADVLIHVFPRKEIAVAAREAGIRYRIGTSHRFHHLLTCNRLAHFTRRRSELHEAQLNVKLLRPLGVKEVPSLSELPAFYGLTKVNPLAENLKGLLAKQRLNVIVHPKSMGNANEWSLENYARLIDSLPVDRYQVFVSGTEEEEVAIGEQLPFDKPNVVSLLGKLKLSEFIAFASEADALVAASTGPLHLAAALGLHAIGLYAPMRPRDPGRWGPVGEHAHALVFDPDCETCGAGLVCDCIQEISPAEIVEILGSLADRRP